MITILANPRAIHQVSHQRALASGLNAIGVQSFLQSDETSIATKMVACWGWRKGAKLRLRGHEVLVMERGYIGDRFKYTSLGWNGLNNYAEFPEYDDDGGRRFREHGGELKTWNKDGSYILILGQVKGDASLKGLDISRWYENVAKEALRKYKIPVYFRPHPESTRRGGYFFVNGIENLQGDLKESVNSALFTIAYNSNSCLDSVLAGIPCYAGDKGTMAWDLCSQDMSEIRRPDRESVVSKIAQTQWSMEEIETGKALVKLMAMKCPSMS